MSTLENKKIKIPKTILLAGIILIIIVATIILLLKGSNPSKAMYNEIQELYDDQDFVSAAKKMQEFMDDFGGQDEDVDADIVYLNTKIEISLANLSVQNDNYKACNTYLEFYPNGEYIEDVKKAYTKIQLATAKEYEANGEFDMAIHYLEDALNKGAPSSLYGKEAKNIKDKINNNRATSASQKLSSSTIGYQNMVNRNNKLYWIYSLQCPHCYEMNDYSLFDVPQSEIDKHYSGDTETVIVSYICQNNLCTRSFDVELIIKYTKE